VIPVLMDVGALQKYERHLLTEEMSCLESVNELRQDRPTERSMVIIRNDYENWTCVNCVCVWVWVCIYECVHHGCTGGELCRNLSIIDVARLSLVVT